MRTKGVVGSGSRASTYAAMLGLGTGILITGLVLPYAVGERVGSGGIGSDAAPVSATLDGPAGADVAAEPGSESGLRPQDGGTAPDAVGGSGDASSGGDLPSSPPDAQTSAQGGAPTSPSAGQAALTATDVGVTPTSIKIGFLLLDVGGIGQVGIGVPGVEPEQQRRAFEAQMAHVNERGGVHGRKLEGFYEQFDVLSHDDMRRACLALRDKKVFAIVAAGGYYGPSMLCVTREGSTPLITQGGQGTPAEYVRLSRGLLFAMYPISDRLMSNWAAELHQMNRLRGKRIGIMSTETTNPSDTVVGGELVPALKRFGYEPAHISNFSGDPNTAASQVPIEVQQMRSKNVDVVMVLAGTLVATQFVQSADNQGYRPQYTVTDWASLNTDASLQNMPSSFDGTIGITTYRTGEEKVGVKENAAERECRAIYEKRTGQKLDAKGSNQQGLMVTNCTTLLALTLGLERTGPNLTRPRFSGGMQSVGSFPMTLWGGGGFGKGKFGAADLVRTIRWYADCRCLKPTSAFHRSQF